MNVYSTVPLSTVKPVVTSKRTTDPTPWSFTGEHNYFTNLPLSARKSFNALAVGCSRSSRGGTTCPRPTTSEGSLQRTYSRDGAGGEGDKQTTGARCIHHIFEDLTFPRHCAAITRSKCWRSILSVAAAPCCRLPCCVCPAGGRVCVIARRSSDSAANFCAAARVCQTGGGVEVIFHNTGTSAWTASLSSTCFSTSLVLTIPVMTMVGSWLQYFPTGAVVTNTFQGPYALYSG